MKPESYNPLTRHTRQVGILCEATGKIVNRISYAFLDHAAIDGVTVYIDGGDMFKIHRTLRNRTQVVYYQWIDGAHDSGKTVDLNGLLKGVGRQAYFRGLPFNERWGKESLGYWIGYKESENLMWASPF